MEFEKLKPVFAQSRRKGLTKILPVKVRHDGPSFGELIPVPPNDLFWPEEMFQSKPLCRVKQKLVRILQELGRWFPRMATLFRREEAADVILRILHVVRRGFTR